MRKSKRHRRVRDVLRDRTTPRDRPTMPLPAERSDRPEAEEGELIDEFEVRRHSRLAAR